MIFSFRQCNHFMDITHKCFYRFVGNLDAVISKNSSIRILSSFGIRRKELIRNTKQCAKGSNIAKYAWTSDHKIDFDNLMSQSLTKDTIASERHWIHGTRLKLSRLTTTPAR